MQKIKIWRHLSLISIAYIAICTYARKNTEEDTA